MDDDVVHTSCGKRSRDGRKLHEVWPSTYNGKNSLDARANGQCAPRIWATTHTVRSRMPRSLSSDHSRMYSVSSETTCSKSVTWFRPCTCHGPVIPGFTSNRA